MKCWSIVCKTFLWIPFQNFGTRFFWELWKIHFTVIPFHDFPLRPHDLQFNSLKKMQQEYLVNGQRSNEFNASDFAIFFNFCHGGHRTGPASQERHGSIEDFQIDSIIAGTDNWNGRYIEDLHMTYDSIRYVGVIVADFCVLEPICWDPLVLERTRDQAGKSPCLPIITASSPQACDEPQNSQNTTPITLTSSQRGHIW